MLSGPGWQNRMPTGPLPSKITPAPLNGFQKPRFPETPTLSLGGPMKVRSLLVWLLFVVLYSSQSMAASRIEFILDVSGSMNKVFGGEKRIESARKSIASALASIPEGSIVSLRLYGHRVPHTNREASCKDTELIVPFGPINKQQMIGIVNQAHPLGETPIAYSLEQAALDFANMPSDEQPVIILVSDGEESCGGDPVATAKALLAKGFKVKIHTIGLDVDANARTQLEGISQATGGTYKDVKDPTALTESLRQLTQQSFIQKENVAMGETIRGGDSFDTAVQILPGKIYKLDHHQRKDQYDYFYVEVKSGQKIEASIETTAKGISGEENPRENSNPYAGISLHSPKREKIDQEQIIGETNKKKTATATVPAEEEGRYYIMIGNSYDPQHKDSPFQVVLKPYFDGNSQQDAPSSDAQALEINVGNYEKNYLDSFDKTDVFKFKSTPGASYTVVARPEQKGEVRLTVLDPDGVELNHGESRGEGSAVRLEGLQTNREGYIFVRVAHRYSSGADLVYALNISKSGDAPVPSAAPGGENPANQNPVATPSPAGTAAHPTPQTLILPQAQIGAEESVCQSFSQLSFFGKAKLIALYVGLPALAAFLIGFIWGYVRGRKTGKRKAQMQNT